MFVEAAPWRAVGHLVAGLRPQPRHVVAKALLFFFTNFWRVRSLPLVRAHRPWSSGGRRAQLGVARVVNTPLRRLIEVEIPLSRVWMVATKQHLARRLPRGPVYAPAHEKQYRWQVQIPIALVSTSDLKAQPLLYLLISSFSWIRLWMISRRRTVGSIRRKLGKIRDSKFKSIKNYVVKLFL